VGVFWYVKRRSPVRALAGILGKRLRPSVEEVTGRNHGVAGRTVAVVFSVSSPSGGGGEEGEGGAWLRGAAERVPDPVYSIVNCL
jgi:hypothetical protein